MNCRVSIILSGLPLFTRAEKHYHNDFLDCWGWGAGEAGGDGEAGGAGEAM
ncbi:hypothetical protein [Coleofasciculus sp.]|uniref:hypothetical protein n=1 Tax=Coleofasciculus sp. TaxID=3100458 RepID=UPI003A16B6FF